MCVCQNYTYWFCLDPEWCSLTQGVVICAKCAGVHRSLGVDISQVRSFTLDRFTMEMYTQLVRAACVVSWGVSVLASSPLRRLGVATPALIQTLRSIVTTMRSLVQIQPMLNGYYLYKTNTSINSTPHPVMMRNRCAADGYHFDGVTQLFVIWVCGGGIWQETLTRLAHYFMILGSGDVLESATRVPSLFEAEFRPAILYR